MSEEKKLKKVSASPHVRDSITTSKIMLLVCAALIPAVVAGTVIYGFRALLVVLVSVASAAAFEVLYEWIVKKPLTVKDGSALVTGLLLGLNMPPSIPLWVPVVGSAFAIIVVKMLYGGLGQNFMNPALAGRCFLLISFTGLMTDYTATKGFVGIVANGAVSAPESALDALSSATPLAYLKQGIAFDPKALFFGNTMGVIGETCALALLAGGIFLIFMKIIDWRIPVFYIGTFAVLVLLTAAIRHYSEPFVFTLSEVLAGGLMLGAFFMATDYVTSPVTPLGRIIFGIILGILTFLFRMVGSSAEGVSYAIIFGNCLVPIIEHFTLPTAFGIVKGRKGEKA